jgi:hypothetical protein
MRSGVATGQNDAYPTFLFSLSLSLIVLAGGIG